MLKKMFPKAHHDEFADLAARIAADPNHPLTVLVREKVALGRANQALLRAKKVRIHDLPLRPAHLRFAHLAPWGITKDQYTDEQVVLREIHAALWRLGLSLRHTARLKPDQILHRHLAYLEAEDAARQAKRKARKDSFANCRVHNGRYLCLDCRRVNAHSRECARSEDRLVVLPRAARVPRHDASPTRWKEFGRAMAAIGTPPGKALGKAFA